jgi:hypothetical protein
VGLLFAFLFLQLIIFRLWKFELAVVLLVEAALDELGVSIAEVDKFVSVLIADFDLNVFSL